MDISELTKQLEEELEDLKHSRRNMGDMAINIIVDQSDQNNMFFVEIEDDNGKSIRIGEQLDDGELTKIRISIDDIFLHEST